MAQSSHAAATENAGIFPEEIMVEILVRLPARDILRFRAACKLWCRLASNPAFLLTHHLRQPALPLLQSIRNSRDEDEDAFLRRRNNFCLEAVDLRAALPRQMLVRFNGFQSIQFTSLSVHGSCDGLLLLNNLDAHFVCNPATRQWVRLPRFPRFECHISGFYAHADSKEYRVLYLHREYGDEWKYYVLTVGSQQQTRFIGCRPSPDSIAEELAIGEPEISCTMPPVLLHGSLHWPRQTLQNNIRVFDTAAESFRWMRPPDISNRTKCFLFGTNEGKLALYSFNQDRWMAELWILQDYKNEAWALTYRIEVPTDNRVCQGYIPHDLTIVSQDGDMFVDVWRMVLHFDKDGSLLQTFSCGDRSVIDFTLHFFRESLVQHPFFPKQKDDDPMGPPFFKRLRTSQCVTAATMPDGELAGTELSTTGRSKSTREKKPSVRVTGPEWVGR